MDIHGFLMHYEFMKTAPIQGAIECFHLLFLSRLGNRVDRSLFALKGGSNLRFFLKSPRYSEDIDLDIKTIAPETLARNVNRILGDTHFLAALKTRGLEIAQTAKKKQSSTTQRWKLLLKFQNTSALLPTRIEFSRRRLEERITMEPVDPEIIQQHRLTPMLVPHYEKEMALVQKIRALARRSAVQARDVFDIKHLLDMGVTTEAIPPLASVDLDKAVEQVGLLSFNDFRSQVAPFLTHDFQQHFSQPQYWKSMCQSVVKLLETFQQQKFHPGRGGR